MNDTKNILLAWVSSLSSIITALETGAWLTIFSAIVLPIAFFTLGKTIDILLQIYLRRREENTTGVDRDLNPEKRKSTITENSDDL